MLEFINISKKFGDKILFDNMNLTIEDGEFVAVTGPSGCGKTTLLHMIGSIENPDSGEILCDGKNIYEKKNHREYLQRKIGFLFQNFALVDRKTVRENLLLVDKKIRTDISIEEALKYVGMLDCIDTEVYKLSGGEQQRVALARLLVKQCDIVLADEPTGSLDYKNAQTVMDILSKMNKGGKTIIMVTHSLELIKYAKRNISLEKEMDF